MSPFLHLKQALKKHNGKWGGGGPVTVPTGGSEYHFYNLSISNPVD